VRQRCGERHACALSYSSAGLPGIGGLSGSHQARQHTPRSPLLTFQVPLVSPPLSSMATLPGVAAGSSSGRCGACSGPPI
jgi:hypothetical protein